MHKYVSTIVPVNKLKIRSHNTYVPFYAPLCLLSVNIVTLSPFACKLEVLKTQAATRSAVAVRCFVEVKTFCAEPVILLPSVRNSRSVWLLLPIKL